MIIQSNVAAMNANRILGKTNELRSKSSGKLSSGSRIRAAADDSAGVAISEKMRGQIRGLGQASRNSQDAISLIQTAEGGMAVANDIVKRMRELAVYGASDVCEEMDRASIQEEIDQLVKELDTLATDTEFNDMTLLDGSLGKGGELSETHQDILKYLKGSWIEESLDLIKSQIGLDLPNDINLEVVFKETEGALATMSRTFPTNNYTLSINPAYFSDTATITDDGVEYWPGQTMDRTIAHEITHAVMFANVSTSTILTIPNWFAEGLAVAVEGGSDTRLAGMSNAQLSSLMGSFSATTSGDLSYTAGYMAVMYMDYMGSGNNIATLMNHLETKDFNTAVYDTFGMSTNDLVNVIKSAASSPSSIPTFLTDAHIDTTQPSMLGGKTAATASDVVPASTKAADYTDGDIITDPSSGSKITVDWPDSLFGQPLFFQVGANTGDIMKVDIGGISSSILGLNNISVMDHHSASNAIGKLETATSKITSLRGQLGAYQNRLEYKTNNLDISGENLTAAESRIRDLDMAKEMVTYTKANILSQSGTAMLSTANQSVNTVLQLLG